MRECHLDDNLNYSIAYIYAIKFRYCIFLFVTYWKTEILYFDDSIPILHCKVIFCVQIVVTFWANTNNVISEMENINPKSEGGSIYHLDSTFLS